MYRFLNKINLYTKTQYITLQNTAEKINNKLNEKIATQQKMILELQKQFKKDLETTKEVSYKQGQDDGHKITMNIPSITYTPTPPIPLIPNDKFIFTKSDEDIKKDIGLLGFDDPTSEQWTMILCKNKNRLIVAGAGSGKSTTIVTRIFVLYKYAGIPLSDITMFSFTKKSCEEFRLKLSKFFTKAGIPKEPEDFKSLVRTFHSKILEFANKSGIVSPEDIFEHIGDDNGNSDDIFRLKLTTAQIGILKDIHNEVWANNKDYRKRLIELWINEQSKIFRRGKDDNVSADKCLLALSNSKLLAEKFQSAFTTTLFTPTIEQKHLSSLHKNKIFYYHGYLESMDIYLVFYPDAETLEKLEINDEPFPDSSSKYKLTTCIWLQERMLTTLFDGKIIFIKNQQQLDEIELMYNFLEDSPPQHTKNFIPSLKAPGELGEKPIYEVLYSQMSFAESSGFSLKNLEELSREILSDKNMKHIDKTYFLLLLDYWEQFNKYLDEKQMRRYSELFCAFSLNNIENYRFAERTVKNMKHIFIDEFQDISPEIVLWIKGALKYLGSINEDRSLMCVGDDWQSIYGWRGSNPDYLVDYKKHFSCNNEHLKMNYNFRSVQNIIDKAETLTKVLKKKIDKKGVSRVQTNLASDSFSVKQNTPNAHEIRRLIEEYKAKYPTAKIYLLSRTNEDIKHVRLSGLEDVHKMTFHSSKGLEADICILLGDCKAMSGGGYKNTIFRLAGNNVTFDETQQDEALRLAYVAATRAKYIVDWYGIESTSPIAKLL